MSTTTRVIPLTTTFIPPSSCLLINPVQTSANEINASYGDDISASFDDVSATSMVYTIGPTTSASQCFPSGWKSSSYFSPGLCPSGYTVGFSTRVNINTITETRASCCPSYVTGIHPLLWSYWELEACTNSITLDRELNANAGQTGAPCHGWAVDANGSYLGVLYADAVSIRWQSTDFTQATATTIYTTSTDLPEIPTGQHSGLPEIPTYHHSGLTTGAKAGIGVGVTLGVILAVGGALGFFYFLRKRRGGLSQAPDEPGNMTGPGNKTEMNAVADQQPAELPTPTYFTAELPSNHFSFQEPMPAELDGRHEHEK
ncbi:uncharacterized protein N7498_004392 [Penicillium cinerascens]|uniref:Mid2 domain-containing protein n=1 Tax=Penicillium cinerascens TaxID=70096 RepID=A0A9W9N414_9EURO|nr:uncharacterized protein N7498_004392 [Penicillium cinerascens]KAJ5212746.1 hypothetical protein N7498_004392 [Penicillium cinerascens]